MRKRKVAQEPIRHNTGISLLNESQFQDTNNLQPVFAETYRNSTPVNYRTPRLSLTASRKTKQIDSTEFIQRRNSYYQEAGNNVTN